jgi:hypothetical protein
MSRYDKFSGERTDIPEDYYEAVRFIQRAIFHLVNRGGWGNSGIEVLNLTWQEINRSI